MGTVYLIHFAKKLSNHALHYIGYSDIFENRIKRHKKGNGAAILRALNEKNIEWDVVRIWENVSYKMEKYLKRQKNAKRYCPICSKKILNPKRKNYDRE